MVEGFLVHVELSQRHIDGGVDVPLRACAFCREVLLIFCAAECILGHLPGRPAAAGGRVMSQFSIPFVQVVLGQPAVVRSTFLPRALEKNLESVLLQFLLVVANHFEWRTAFGCHI